MIRRITRKFICFIAEDNYKLEEREEMEYMLNTFIFEVFKMSGAIIFFSFLGYFRECLVIMGSSFIVKPFIGGYHEETQMRCFIATLLFTELELIMGMQAQFSFVSNLLIILLCIFCIYHRAPVINSNMPITFSDSIKNNRKKGLIYTGILGIVSILIYNYSIYYSLITWTLIINTMLMFNKRNSEDLRRD